MRKPMILCKSFTYKEFGVEELESVSASLPTAKDLVDKGLAQEAVRLMTCNRCEFVIVTEEREKLELYIHEKIAAVLPGNPGRTYIKRNAVHHLFRLATSIDSMVVGENQILSQIRKAEEVAIKEKTIGPLLRKLFVEARRTGRKVRRETELGVGAVSIASVAADLAVKIFGNLEGIRTLILGAGEMSSIAAKHLASRGSEIEILVHRNRKRARDLALKVSGVTVEPELFEQRLEKVDIVAAATSAKYKLLTCDAVKSILGRRRGRPLFLIDLANPRNFESGIGELEGAYLYDLDDFEKIASRHRERRLQAVAEAEQIVESSLENWARIEKLMTQSDVIALAHINLMKMEADLGEKLNTPLLRKQARKQLRRLFHVSRMSLLEDNDIQREINVEVFKSIFGVSSRQLP